MQPERPLMLPKIAETLGAKKVTSGWRQKTLTMTPSLSIQRAQMGRY